MSQGPLKCTDKGVARRCEAEGGIKVEFQTYILSLWKKIGYSSDNHDFTDVQEDREGDTGPSFSQQEGGTFTPAKGPLLDTGLLTGVSIRLFPRGTDQGDI